MNSFMVIIPMERYCKCSAVNQAYKVVLTFEFVEEILRVTVHVKVVLTLEYVDETLTMRPLVQFCGSFLCKENNCELCKLLNRWRNYPQTQGISFEECTIILSAAQIVIFYCVFPHLTLNHSVTVIMLKIKLLQNPSVMFTQRVCSVRLSVIPLNIVHCPPKACP